MDDVDPLALLAHDLKSSLGIVRGAVRQVLEGGLDREPLTERQRGVLELAERNATLAEELVATLRSGRVPIGAARETEASGTTLAEILGAAAASGAGPAAVEGAGGRATGDFASTREQLAARGIEVALEPGLAEAPIVCPRLALVRILSNLLDNALRHGRGGTVRLEAARAGERLRLVVTDEGPGLPEEVRHFLEAPRSQPLPWKDGRRPVGLASVRWLVKHISGRLTLEPSARGARVAIDVPLGASGRL
jgi:signal transduction histidine kinase